MEGHGEGEEQDIFLCGAGSEEPQTPEMSVPGPTASVGTDGRVGWYQRSPFPRPAALPVPYLAQSAARAKGRFWKKLPSPPAAVCPQFEGFASTPCRAPA